ncbi:MarR family winged helix-turn-helix transcriptional regulator [SCandidatus Aminicenantes bacterium Aminicenantia_JdfR_composite]|nr:MarR family winged helix-turn-helix transcriptional regulator [SCandidatus Aminicenantes bacterium Aminicenantia_JdfR_composite]
MSKEKIKRDLDEKIAFSLERISQIFKILIWEKAKKINLSPIQIQFLLYLNNHESLQCTVTNLAREFALTRATVSDAVKSLINKGLVLKKRSAKDGRIYTLKLSKKGEKAVNELTNWLNPVKEQLGKFPEEVKDRVLFFLMKFIASFQKIGVINTARMCIVCIYFKENAFPGSDKPHYCLLTNQPLALSDLKIDCENNRPKIMDKK